jgi:hypothetical protein
MQTGRLLSAPYSTQSTFTPENRKRGKNSKMRGGKIQKRGKNSILAELRKANPRLKALKRGFLYMCNFKKVFTTNFEGEKIKNRDFNLQEEGMDLFFPP